MPENGKFKVLVLSDHALSTSGVGTQTRHLIEGLLKKNCWTFRQFGAALKHIDYRTIVVNDDFIIKPIDGFGTPELLRVTLATEKPDLLFIKDIGVYVAPNFNLAKEAQLRCYYDVISRIKNNQDLSILSNECINELLDWDLEKYRIKNAK